MKPTVRLFALLALGFALPAQETTAVAASSPLVLKTSNGEFAREMLRKFGGDKTELQEGEMLVLTLDDGGKPQVKVEQGNAGLMQVQAQPARLMEVFGEKIDEARQMAQGMGTFILSQQGLQPAEAIKIIQGVFDFPTQIETASLVVRGDPEAPEQGFDGELALDAKSGTWLGKFVDALTPNEAGAPVLEQSGAMMTAALACKLEDMSMLTPFFEVFSSMGGTGKTPEQREKNIHYMKAGFEAADGTGALSWNPASGGMQIISGLADPDAIKQLWGDADYRKFSEAQARMNPAVEVESDFNAFTHSGVQVMKLVMTMDDNGQPNPMFKDGKAETYTGIADKFMVMSMFGVGDDGIKQLIDAAVGGKVKREALSAGVLGKLSIKLTELVDHMSDGQAPTDEMPENLGLEVGRTGNSLTLKFKAK